jgi:hypothetical protein
MPFGCQLSVHRQVLVLLVGIVAIPGYRQILGQGPVENPERVCIREQLKNHAQVGQFVFKAYLTADDGACLEVVREGKVIFRRTVDSFVGYTLGQPASEEWKIPAIANGTDVTGRRRPNMIVSFSTGGAHCCQFHYVFELEPVFKLLATIDGRDADLAHFEDLESDGRYYYVGADWTFAYWPGSFASSPSHKILLRWVDDDKGGGFHLALDKMEYPAPTAKEWRSALQDVEDTLKEGGPPLEFLGTTLWKTVLDLIYTGHSDLAWKFVDQVNPQALTGDNPSLADFCSKLKKSPYWTDLAPSLSNPPSGCSKAKREQK